MNWNLTEWTVEGFGPYYRLRVYVGKKDSYTIEQAIAAAIGRYFPDATIRKRTTVASGYPEYDIYLGKTPLPDDLAEELNAML